MSVVRLRAGGEKSGKGRMGQTRRNGKKEKMGGRKGGRKEKEKGRGREEEKTIEINPLFPNLLWKFVTDVIHT